MKYIFGIILVMLLAGSATATPFYVNTYQSNNKVNVTLKRVEFDSRYYLGLDGYYSAGQTIHNKLQAEKYEQLSKEHEELKARLDLLLQTLNKQTPEVDPETPAVPTPEPIPQPETPDSNEPYVPTELDKAVYGVFKTHCASCHNEANKKGGIQLIHKANGSLLNQPLETRVLIDWVTRGIELQKHDKKLMPLNSKPLGEQESNIIYLWMTEEATRLREENQE